MINLMNYSSNSFHLRPFLSKLIFVFQEEDIIKGASHIPAHCVHQNEVGDPAWLAGESQGVENPDFSGIHDSLLCKEIFDSSSLFLNGSTLNNIAYRGTASNTKQLTGNNDSNKNNNNAPCGIADLENLDFDTPPDFQLAVSLTSHHNSSACLLYMTNDAQFYESELSIYSAGSAVQFSGSAV